MLRVTHRAWGIPMLLGAALFTHARVAVLLETAIVFGVTHCAWRVPLARAFARLVSCHTIFLSVPLAGLDALPCERGDPPIVPYMRCKRGGSRLLASSVLALIFRMSDAKVIL